MRRLLTIHLAVLALLGSATGANAPVHTSAAQSLNTTSVRVVHASPDAPAVDVLVDGARAITNLAYGEAIGYAELPAGTRAVAVVPAGAEADAAVIQANLELAAGRAYTVMAVGRLAEIAPLVLTDERMAPAGDSAKVRFVHASPNAPAVDIAVKDGPVLFSNVPFKEAAAYIEAPAGTLDLEARLAGTGTVALSVPGVVLEAGKVYTIAAIGLAGDMPPLRALPLFD